METAAVVLTLVGLLPINNRGGVLIVAAVLVATAIALEHNRVGFVIAAHLAEYQLRVFPTACEP